ncbi:MAG TPA: hypothetical protein VK661_06495 [Planctomycetota bacterium]|nr:hypothetical protein [Planctomycetota bacterium]
MSALRPGSGDLPLEAAATALQRILRAMRIQAPVHVRASRDHLAIETEDADGARRVVGRAVPAEGGSFRLTLLVEPGQWEEHPAAGSLEDLAFGVLELLHAHPERAQSPGRARGPRAGR